MNLTIEQVRQVARDMYAAGESRDEVRSHLANGTINLPMNIAAVIAKEELEAFTASQPVVQEPVVQEPVAQQPVVSETVAQQPVNAPALAPSPTGHPKVEAVESLLVQRSKTVVALGVPITPVMGDSKRAFLSDWPTSATTNPTTISGWGVEYPDATNYGCVAKGTPDGVWFLELDSPDVVKRIEAQTGQQIPATFRVRSRPGRGHLYWKNTPASLAMGNLSQAYVKGADWSARVSNQYVVGPNSIHPISKQPYVIVADDPIIECPDWLVAWCVSQKITKDSATKGEPERNAAGQIPHGSIHAWMLRKAGALRRTGLRRRGDLSCAVCAGPQEL